MISKLRLIKLFFRLFAARAAPVIGQVLKRNAVVFGGVVDIAANGANIDSRRFLRGEIDLGKNRRDGMIQIHYALCFEVLIALRRMGAHINGRVAAHKRTHTVERFTRRGKVVEYDGELVLIQRLVNIL